MKIAVLGDIHGNVDALEAVLAEASRAGCDRILHTGGLVGYGARPNETIDLIRTRGIAGVRGHFDESVAWADDAGPGIEEGAGALTVADGSLGWTTRHIGFSQRQFLKDLPFSIRETAGDRELILFHASPIDLYTPIEEDASESWLEELAEETGADIHLFGHTHKPFHRVAGGRHFVNAGSVGRSPDGDPRACLAIVAIDRGVSVEFRRVPYDSETTAQEVEARRLVEDAARVLRTG